MRFVINRAFYKIPAVDNPTRPRTGCRRLNRIQIRCTGPTTPDCPPTRLAPTRRHEAQKIQPKAASPTRCNAAPEAASHHKVRPGAGRTYVRGAWRARSDPRQIPVPETG